jgi:hypothetical protein
MKSAGSAPIQVIAFVDAKPLERVLPIPGIDRFVINPLAPHQSLWPPPVVKPIFIRPVEV